ncbi:outer membrane beta-barrel protein [Acetobacteraceae bacterium ESL0709]|nr:outer membrane beta-barrel protein [Acetobacteraceae bacterium ESL0697]MDF7677341.1 outer membrane beta-barrel protein [Acetobacteraceae bacterium ESL0709]
MKCSHFCRTFLYTGLAVSVSCWVPARAEEQQKVSLGQNVEKNWFSDIDLGLQVEGGIMANTGGHTHGMNFGQLLSSHSNEPLLNQILFTATKPVDSLGSGYGIGFNFQLLYGSDARIFGVAGISDKWINKRYQLTPTAANIALHMPWLTKGGLDGQIGILPSPMGVEVLDATARSFYTLAYSSEYTVPFELLGGYFQWHVADHYNVLFGLDAGNQMSFGKGNNNGRPSGYVGFNGHDLAGGSVSFTDILRIGPENAVDALGKRAHSAQRFWNDLNATWQVSPRWSLTAESTFVHDEALGESWGGVVWAHYKFSDALSFNARTELYRDNSGQFVVQFPGNRDYARALLGHHNGSYGAPPTTYGDLSFNAVWSPKLGYGIKVFQLRPEIRFDRSLSGTRVFDGFHRRSRILIGGDATIGF